MIYFKYSFLLFIALLWTSVFMGCARPPEDERSAARAVMDAAEAAGAAKYVAADFTAARKLWDAAEAQVKEKKYEEAREDYINARSAFAKATSSVAEAKKAVAEEVRDTLPVLEEGWKNLQTLSRRVEKKMTKGKGLWETDAKTFVEDLKAVKETMDTDPGSAREKTMRMRSFLNSYTTLFRQLAAAPAKPETGRKKAGHEDKDE